MPSIEFSELEWAMDFVNAGDILDARAYISRDTGDVYRESDDSDPEEKLPEDIDNPDLYAEVPGQQDLHLGKRLVMEFAARFVPEDLDEIDHMFRRKGAYSRFKDRLNELGKLHEWREYQQSATEKAMIAWAEGEGFVVAKD